jgi:hypothetical protein
MAYETVKLQQLLREIAGRTASQHDADAIRLAADTLDSLAVDAAIARGITNVTPLPEPSGTSDSLPHPNGGRCETCGAETVDHCPVCGAPQCCPSCCADAKAEGTSQDSKQASRSGLSHTHA